MKSIIAIFFSSFLLCSLLACQNSGASGGKCYATASCPQSQKSLVNVVNTEPTHKAKVICEEGGKMIDMYKNHLSYF